MWVPTTSRFLSTGPRNLMEQAVEPAVTTSSLGFTHRMVLPTTWNLNGGTSRYLENNRD